MDLFLAPFLLLLGWVVGFLRAFFFSSTFFNHCVFLRSRSFSFLFGLVDGCNFVSCSFGLNILACISIPIFISSRFYMYAYPYLLRA